MDSSAHQLATNDDQLIIGYVPAFRDEQDWQLAFRQERRGAEGIIRRVVWVDRCEPKNRLLVDVAERFTAMHAASRLESEERDSNVPLERRGSDPLGPRSLIYPKE